MTESTVLDDLQEYINLYMALPDADNQSLLLSVWALHSWAFDVAQTTPYLYVTSPEKGSGKSTLIDVLETITRNPMATIDATGPVLFRAIDASQPTLMIDEADAIWSGARNEGLRGIINGGYKMGGKAWRTKGAEVIKFNTFCPKLLAGIHNGKLPDTILDRSIPVILKRKRPGQDTLPFNRYEAAELAESILDRIDEWYEANADALAVSKMTSVEGMSDRTSEISWPLLAIAETFGKRAEMEAAIVSCITTYRDTMATPDDTRELFEAISSLFDSIGKANVHTEDILTALEMANDSKAAKALAERFEPYGIESRNVRVGTKVAKGYRREDFADAFGSYGL